MPDICPVCLKGVGNGSQCGQCGGWLQYKCENTTKDGIETDYAKNGIATEYTKDGAYTC